eukprot:CAMPEP_0174828804 /NCGR_PEP_ID=MMETSP1114-20130205/1547_1 /TAXON_ID=312471 /ORGANISM="Neobodo designis, Strain CCAP 1951/1" /LENGTH=271 /DNA_ID=CAMNT_0016062529 /DNA_START=41 /DNA_END=856 /DNA_ORIENTATION=+
MAPKAKKKADAGDKGGAGAGAAATGGDFPVIPESLRTRHPTRWVQVHFKLLTSSLLDDVVRLPQSATLHAVEQHLVNHHGGGISKLVFWKDDIQPKTIQRDFSRTLREVWNLDDATPRTITNPNPSALGGGVRRFGAFDDPQDHQVVLCYDYKAHDSDCPLVLRSPRYTIEGFSGGTKTTGLVGAVDAKSGKQQQPQQSTAAAQGTPSQAQPGGTQSGAQPSSPADTGAGKPPADANGSVSQGKSETPTGAAAANTSTDGAAAQPAAMPAA